MESSGAEPLAVLHVFRSPLGGLFRHVKDLALGQAARGCRVGLVFDERAVDAATEESIAELAPHMSLGVHRLPMRRGAAFSDVANIGALLRLCARLEPDVLHGHGAKGGLYTRAGALNPFNRLPLRVYTPHGGSVHYWSRRLVGLPVRAAEALLARVTDVFLFESKFIADRFREITKIPGDRCRISPNGVREDEFAPVKSAPQPADFVYVGELRYLKGVDVLLDALAEMERRDGRPTSTVIVGSGPDQAALEAHALRLGLADRVRFAGRLPCEQALGMGRVLVVPSRRESLPYIVLEAAAGGVPMVATTAGGIPEIFGPHADRLVPPDDVAALTAALLAMRDAPDAQRTHDTNALFEHVQRRFSLSIMVDNSLAAYREGLTRDGRARHTPPSVLSTP